MTIGEYVFDFIINTFFGGTYNNAWLTQNIDKIQGIMTVIISAIIFFISVLIVWAIFRAIQKIFSFWE